MQIVLGSDQNFLKILTYFFLSFTFFFIAGEPVSSKYLSKVVVGVITDSGVGFTGFKRISNPRLFGVITDKGIGLTGF